jgi:hypothetical protein
MEEGTLVEFWRRTNLHPSLLRWDRISCPRSLRAVTSRDTVGMEIPSSSAIMGVEYPPERIRRNTVANRRSMSRERWYSISESSGCMFVYRPMIDLSNGLCKSKQSKIAVIWLTGARLVNCSSSGMPSHDLLNRPTAKPSATYLKTLEAWNSRFSVVGRAHTSLGSRTGIPSSL